MPAPSPTGIHSPIRQVAKTAAASALGCDAETATRLGVAPAGVATGAKDATGGFVGDVVAFDGPVTTAPAGTPPTRGTGRTGSGTSLRPALHPRVNRTVSRSSAAY